MTIDHAALAAEITNDPTGMGYAAPFAAGNDSAVAGLLNSLVDGATVDRQLVEGWEIVNAVIPAEYAALTAPAREYLRMVVSPAWVQLAPGGTRSGLAVLFGGGTTTRANLLALTTRAATRAEVLFGLDMTIVAADVAQARGI